jgi:hypothetical protein
MPGGLAARYEYFRGTCCVPLQGRLSALKMEAERSTEILNTYKTTQHHSQEYDHLNIRHSEHLKFHPMDIVNGVIH